MFQVTYDCIVFLCVVDASLHSRMEHNRTFSGDGFVPRTFFVVASGAVRGNPKSQIDFECSRLIRTGPTVSCCCTVCTSSSIVHLDSTRRSSGQERDLCRIDPVNTNNNDVHGPRSEQKNAVLHEVPLKSRIVRLSQFFET